MFAKLACPKSIPSGASRQTTLANRERGGRFAQNAIKVSQKSSGLRLRSSSPSPSALHQGRSASAFAKAPSPLMWPLLIVLSNACTNFLCAAERAARADRKAFNSFRNLNAFSARGDVESRGGKIQKIYEATRTLARRATSHPQSCADVPKSNVLMDNRIACR